jgi:hypothetical protein
MARPEARRERLERVGRWTVRLLSYRLGDEYLCTADNVDPGANLARSRGVTREAAEAEALARAADRLGATRVFEGPGSTPR